MLLKTFFFVLSQQIFINVKNGFYSLLSCIFFVMKQYVIKYILFFTKREKRKRKKNKKIIKKICGQWLRDFDKIISSICNVTLILYITFYYVAQL